MSDTKKESRRIPAWIDLVSGGTGGAAAKSLLAPFQRVVVMQQLGEHRQMNALQIANMIHKKEGAKGFFRGNLTSVIIRFPYSGLQFVFYGKVKFAVEQACGITTDTQNTGSVMMQKFLVKCGAGGICATLAGVFVYPGEVVRLRLMSGEERFRTISGTVGLVWKETNSPKNFYRGLNASLAQRVPDILINFAVYETVKFGLAARQWNDTLSTIAGASSAALTAIAFSFPLDIAKRRIGMAGQGKSGKTYKGVLDCLSTIYRADGIRGLYAGAPLEAGRCVPQVVLMWLAVENCRDLLMKTFA
jgi:hypothetical protein